MAESLPSYKKLPGRAASSIVGAERLWYTDDHLMCVFTAFGTESYQRVYFREIEALVLRRTSGRLIWNIVFGVILAFAIALTLLLNSGESPTDPIGGGFITGLSVTLAIAAVLALIGLIVNTFKGPTCTFWAQTPGGIMRLRAPVRVPAARKVVRILTPLIAEAQGNRAATPTVTP